MKAMTENAHNVKLCFVLIAYLLVFVQSTVDKSCDVVIVGGTTAAFAAAVSSAAEGVQTCLIEPTDWVGGQLTASGVSAIDFAWETRKVGNKTFPVYKYARMPENITPSFTEILKLTNNTGRCWVSTNCYLPQTMLENALHPLEAKYSKTLRVFRNSVIKRAKYDKKAGIIQSIDVIQRTIKQGVACKGYDILLHSDLPDWYSELNTQRYSKQVTRFVAPLFIDATEWGELMAVSNADYLQGIAEQFDGDVSGKGNPGDDTCGQSTVFGFAEIYNAEKNKEPANPYPVPYPNHYKEVMEHTWELIWTYRRLYSRGTEKPQVGDITLQNYSGNDFPYGYILTSRQETQKTVVDDAWMGGINMTTLKEAEYLAYGWHYWFKQNSTISDYMTLKKDVFGTCHGLVKVPYLRDTRRSIGIDDFVIRIADLSGDFTKSLTGFVYPDRVAIGNYPCDIHSLRHCEYKDYMKNEYQTLPFFIPFRAMTNRVYGNLLVTGKTMAQSFMSNAAVRLHPIEYSSGTATGVAAAYMIKNKLSTTRQAYEQISTIQTIIAKYTPIRWLIEGKYYPEK
jgi:hypothetical protein